MLMTGSIGMLGSTLPVQWLLPLWGWRGLFWAVAAQLVVAMLLTLWLVPRDPQASATPQASGGGSYLAIVRHPLFLRMAPLAFFVYGGLIAVQALWAGPWLTQVTGASAEAAARGLFVINLAMMFTFMAWGVLMPPLARRGLGAITLMTWGVPLSLLLLAINIGLGAGAGALHWAAWCISCTFVSLSQPLFGQAFPSALAGRALSAFNLVIFGGVFCLQWGIGLLIDALQALGMAEPRAFQFAFGAFLLCCVAAYGVFVLAGRFRVDNGH
jgi:predicted MFS family arabinose efflux permease